MTENITNSAEQGKDMDLASNANKIQQMAISELLRGEERYFFIPSYQRGYRWGKTQIYDLCNDLLDYALKKEQEASDLIQNKSFYCLQPIIVIPKKRFEIKNHGVYDGFEVVDGQQRLTSLYILYRYLVSKAKNLILLINTDIRGKDEMVERDYGTKLYHIYYETRPDDYDTIEKTGYEDFTEADIKDIDIAHISNAYQYITQWIEDVEDGAPKVLKRYPKTGIKSQNDIITCLLTILHNGKDSPRGSVQVIWYELESGKDAVKEFIKENTGKIKLTDTELIKGLFLQKRNWNKAVAGLQQLSIGKDWELIENTLHHNDFWAFLSDDIHQEDNRINIVFEYIYQKHHGGDAAPKDSQNALFRFYSEYFEQHLGEAKGGMTSLWNEVMECFQAMQNWYNDPYIYNLVGLLSKCGKKLYDIVTLYEQKEVVSTEDFLWKLKEEVLKELPKPADNTDIVSPFPPRYFNLFYGTKNDESIRALLRFVNVRQLCCQLDQARNDIEKKEKKSDQGRTEQDLMNHIYKFPYDVMESFSWDVEHVDSATTNQLKKTEEKEEWVEEAEKLLGVIIINDANYQSLKTKYQQESSNKDNNLNELIKLIKTLAQDDFEDEEMKKNWIGNLTLLDCGTNRQYRNALFAVKHQKIQERVKQGIFVPTCTKNVFDKNFDGCTEGLWRWDWNDKCCHHRFLLEQYEKFANEIKEHQKQKKEIVEPKNI